MWNLLTVIETNSSEFLGVKFKNIKLELIDTIKRHLDVKLRSENKIELLDKLGSAH